MVPGLNIRVRDSFVDGTGFMLGSVLGLFPLVRSIHELFSVSGRRVPIERASGESHEDTDGPADAVLNDEDHANVDHGTFVTFKGKCLEAGALVGGFAKLRGNRVLVMGPRTHWGIRSFASVSRARELFQTANKTRPPKWGSRCRAPVHSEDASCVDGGLD
jgi:hypothetical protein